MANKTLGVLEERISLFFEAGKRVLVIGAIAGAMAQVTTVPIGGFVGFVGWVLVVTWGQVKRKLIAESNPPIHTTPFRRRAGTVLELIAALVGGLVLFTVMQFVIGVEAGVPPRVGGVELSEWKSMFSR